MMKCIIHHNVCLVLFYYVLGVIGVTNFNKTMPPRVQKILEKANVSSIKELLNGRRILRGVEAGDKRPYMVYLKLPKHNKKFGDYRHWLCAGVIVDVNFIITSAACIEDVKHFYVVSGTYRHNEEDDRFTNPCIKNNARKAIWKCVPRNYVFDGHENDNIRWMNNDIAVVKVEEEFVFDKRVRGCDFVEKPIRYNNKSVDLERPGIFVTTAGWGSTDKYNDWINGRRTDAVFKNDLLETTAIIISKGKCKQKWGKRYQQIIDNYMICTKDLNQEISDICSEKYSVCTDLSYAYDDDSGESVARRAGSSKYELQSARHNSSRRTAQLFGGFCENDHGGPLVNGDGVNAILIGIISSCLVKERTNKCHGPFLYTSVYRNRKFITCAIYGNSKECDGPSFRSGAGATTEETTISWVDHPDGPAKNELSAMRRQQQFASTANEHQQGTASTQKMEGKPSPGSGLMFKTNVNKKTNQSQA